MPYANRAAQLAYQRKWDRKNLKRKLKSKYARRRRFAERLAAYKKTLRCERCPESHPATLDFHHPNPKVKEFSIGNACNLDWGWERVLKEIKKCVVLCSNCHRKEHYDE